MLPEFLQSSYARYKADTNTFATWLLETANKCGYEPTLSATVPPVNKSKRRGKPDGSNEHPIQYSATTKDLQKFAEVIAGSSLSVPRSVLTIAKRAIKLRKTVTSWFLGRGDIANNKRHAHLSLRWSKSARILNGRPPSPPSQMLSSHSQRLRLTMTTPMLTGS